MGDEPNGYSQFGVCVSVRLFFCSLRVFFIRTIQMCVLCLWYVFCVLLLAACCSHHFQFTLDVLLSASIAVRIKPLIHVNARDFFSGDLFSLLKRPTDVFSKWIKKIDEEEEEERTTTTTTRSNTEKNKIDTQKPKNAFCIIAWLDTISLLRPF